MKGIIGQRAKDAEQAKTPICYSSFHFLFHYLYITPIYSQYILYILYIIPIYDYKLLVRVGNLG